MAARARGMRGARKMRAFAKDPVASISSEEAFETALQRAGGLLVAEFGTSWSAPCKAMAPYMAALAAQPGFKGVTFVRVDIEALGARLGVTMAPSYHFYRDKRLLDSFSGALPPKLMELLAKHKGDVANKPNNRLLLLLGAVVCGILAVTYIRANETAAATPAPPEGELVAVPVPAEEAAPGRPVRKRAVGPSRGARKS